MNVSCSKHARGVLITLEGHMDSVHSPAAAAALEQITDEGAPLYVFDCARLTYVSSAGLRVFLQIAKKVKAKFGSRLAVTALDPSVAEVFEIAGFGTMFRICKSPADCGLE